MKFLPLSTKTLAHLYTAYGVRGWALPSNTVSNRKAVVTKARKGRFIGKSGIFHCSQTERVHMPSIILSLPEAESGVAREIPPDSIWPGTYYGFFQIQPLTPPNVSLPREVVEELLQVDSGIMLNGRYFTLAEADEEGWSELIARFLSLSK